MPSWSSGDLQGSDVFWTRSPFICLFERLNGYDKLITRKEVKCTLWWTVPVISPLASYAIDGLDLRRGNSCVISCSWRIWRRRFWFCWSKSVSCIWKSRSFVFLKHVLEGRFQKWGSQCCVRWNVRTWKIMICECGSSSITCYRSSCALCSMPHKETASLYNAYLFRWFWVLALYRILVI